VFTSLVGHNSLAPVPITVVLGESACAKTQWLKQLVQSNNQALAVINNSPGVNISLPVILVDIQASCACCAGELVLRSNLVRLLRTKQAKHIVLIAHPQAKPGALLDAITSPGLAGACYVAQVLFPVHTTDPAPVDTDLALGCLQASSALIGQPPVWLEALQAQLPFKVPTLGINQALDEWPVSALMKAQQWVESEAKADEVHLMAAAPSPISRDVLLAWLNSVHQQTPLARVRGVWPSTARWNQMMGQIERLAVTTTQARGPARLLLQFRTLPGDTVRRDLLTQLLAL
jgi:hypothetical protein